MEQAAFAYLADMLKRRSGLSLPHSKFHLLQTRLKPVAARFGFKSVEALLHALPHVTEPAIQAVVEAMTTNDTWFFRDKTPFEVFREAMLPALMTARENTRVLRIWCAAAATGQEPYSIAVALDEAGLLSSKWRVELIATDINTESLARAREGLYSSYEVQRGLGIRRLLAHFTQEGDMWRISQALRRTVSFRQFNLLDDFAWLGTVDVVFCRNVFLYFDELSKARIMKRIGAIVAPDGYVAVGAAEMPLGFSPQFAGVPGVRGIYRRTRQAALRAAM